MKNHIELRGSGIGRMFQDNHIFQNMTVLENMLVADENKFGEIPFEPFLYFKKNIEIEKNRYNKVSEKLKSLFGEQNGFIDKLNNKSNMLSHGEQRLLGLARLLMGKYRLLLLDEPTSGVSLSYRNDIKTMIRFFVEQEGKTVFLIEHNIDFVKEVADYCFFMVDGIIKFERYTSRSTR